MATKRSFRVLDGAMGSALRDRGVRVPSSFTSVWSAASLIEAPKEVTQLHEDYIKAGADIITTNNYMVTRTALSRAGWENRIEELTVKACQYAIQARTAAGAKEVKIAGSIPPLTNSYQTRNGLEKSETEKQYKEIADIVAQYVDILLCETQPEALEASIAAKAASVHGKPVWVAFTLEDDFALDAAANKLAPVLRSGQSLEYALKNLEGINNLEAVLVNCSDPETCTLAVKEISKLISQDGNVNLDKNIEVGWYSNARPTSDAFKREKEEDGDKRPVEPEFDEKMFASQASDALANGATIVGGCCGTTPEHIKHISKLKQG